MAEASPAPPALGAPAGSARSALRVIVDTDLSLGPPGSEVDDGLALAMVVAETTLDLLAVTTTSGNVDAASAAYLVLDLFRRLDVRTSRSTEVPCRPYATPCPVGRRS